jgi:hypothetical protein
MAALAALATGLSIVAMGIAASQIGSAVRKVQEELEAKDVEKAKEQAGNQRRLLSGLYPTVNGGAKESTIPGMQWIIGAGGLGLMSLLLGLIPSTPSAAAVPAEFTRLGARIDSLASSMAQERMADSIAMLARANVPAPAPGPRKPSRTSVASRAIPPVAIPTAILPDSTLVRLPGQ